MSSWADIVKGHGAPGERPYLPRMKKGEVFFKTEEEAQAAFDSYDCMSARQLNVLRRLATVWCIEQSYLHIPKDVVKLIVGKIELDDEHPIKRYVSFKVIIYYRPTYIVFIQNGDVITHVAWSPVNGKRVVSKTHSLCKMFKTFREYIYDHILELVHGKRQFVTIYQWVQYDWNRVGVPRKMLGHLSCTEHDTYQEKTIQWVFPDIERDDTGKICYRWSTSS